MNVVDSSAWLSYFAGDKYSDYFAKSIETIDELLVPSITITEVFKTILRQRDEEAALLATAHMEQGKVVSLDVELSVVAAYYGVEHGLPLADSIIYATAQKYNATLWTQDTDFKGLKDVKFHPR
ncbi:MAG: twitching motility protein PilT [Gammaproteobacteria bacterium RIFCSPLOWO2_02_FULL_56_15]|nr:MAG: twitching motility protein PilT [Gammaproteobacteria bacterium RIFCSPLOWO2_02_FULL_56_15]